MTTTQQIKITIAKAEADITECNKQLTSIFWRYDARDIDTSRIKANKQNAQARKRRAIKNLASAE
tara:strand:- start:146 stop:340 length:195 start_codon:yes stop_codon:yes gene_type:complete